MREQLDAGANTQTFGYDRLNRVTGSSGLTAGATTYAYDVDGNLVNPATGSIPLGPAPVYLVPDATTAVSDFSTLTQAATVQ